MKTKKILLGFGLALLGTFAHAQGLENVIVEKYYVSNAADAAGTIGTLPVGSVTYRIYADMLPGYKFQALYGVATHTLQITSSTTFFNNEDRGATTSNAIPSAQLKNNSVALDSWFSTGAAAPGQMGVLKTEDNGLANLLPIISNPMLKNVDPTAGIAVGVQDGIITGTPEAVSFVGLTTELDVFDALSQVGGSFVTTNGSIASLSGSVGPTGTNRVLIGQFTTDGVFGFELNIQIGTPTFGVQNYVARNPVGAELSIPSLILAPNLPPTVSITSPITGVNVITGSSVTFNASASDSDGTVSQVEFFDGVTSIGVDNTSPYSISWVSTTGTHNITAKATDNIGAIGTSAIVVVNAALNQAPIVSVSAPPTASVGSSVNITSVASDIDGTVSQVEFFVDGVSIGIDNTSPYSMNWTAVVGVHSIRATATDNLLATTNSSTISISVAANIPPTASITSPLSSATFTAPQVVTIDASATDPDGTVTQVEFFVNAVSIGTDLTSPYSINWTSVIGTASLTVKSTDNTGAITTSTAVVLSIANPFALPYEVGSIVETCLPTTFCIPVNAQDTVDNVIGYDLVMNYDVTKVTPTGVITLAADLINPGFVDVSNSIDGVNGIIYISAYFNTTAPVTAEFNGIGELFCVEFTKTVAFGSVDTSVVSVSSLQESYFSGVSSKLVDAGEYITYRDTIFNASLKFWSDNSPIKYNVANPNDFLITNVFGNDAACATQSLTAVQPDLFGNFTYSLTNGLDVNIERDILATTSVLPVVNGFDALQVRKLLIFDPTFVPNIYQAIAMDVNTDGVISAGDVSQINQRAVLIIPEFKQAWNYSAAGVSNGELSKDWLFVDSIRLATDVAYAISATFPANDSVGFSKYRVPVVPFCLPVTVTGFATCPLITSEVYRGIMLGDINGNYASIASDGLIKAVETTDKVIFDLSNAVITGNVVNIPVTISAANPINSLDFSLELNNAELAYNSIISHSTSMDALDNLNAADNTLRFTSNSLINYDITAPVVSLSVTMLNGQVNAADLMSVVGYLNGEEVTTEVVGALATGITSINSDNLVAIYPNPTTGILNVVAAENATVQLLDVTGKLVILQTNVTANDKQEINVENLANGIYMLRVSNSNFVSMKKVVINK